MTTGGKVKSKKTVAKKPADKKSKPAAKKASNLGDMKVLELRKLAKASDVKQTNPDGTTKNKKQLVDGLKRAGK